MKATVFKSVIESRRGFYTLSEYDSKGNYISITALSIGEAKKLLDTKEFEHTVVGKDYGTWVKQHGPAPKRRSK